MTGDELQFVRWLQTQRTGRRDTTKLGIGDDMAILEVDGATVLITTDMLLDGVHFSTKDHALEAIGRKAIACSLSDCAAMAARPIAAAVSVALSRSMTMGDAQRLFEGMRAIAEEFDCDIVGGDTTRWDRPLAIDVCMLGGTYPGVKPVTRSGARRGDVLAVTGPLGGSLRGRHLTFAPRVQEARRLVEVLGSDVHAMMDISDGLSLDLFRLCEASGTGAEIHEEALQQIASDDARAAAAADGRSALEHVLEDGEDFELVVAVAPQVAAVNRLRELGLHSIGVVTEAGLVLRESAGGRRVLEPRGYDHFDGPSRSDR